MSETEKIKERYERRKNLVAENRYSYFNKGNLFMVQDREREILRLLNKNGQNNLVDKKIMDIGCGSGTVLREFLSWGAVPDNLFGIDILEERIREGRKINSNFNLFCGNAEKINFPDKTFDLVLQSTCFTSISDDNVKHNIALEMQRILKDTGIILWYDFKYNNPSNPDVKGVKRSEIEALFPNCSYDFNLITLAPPIVRKLAPISWLLCYFLQEIKLLNTHYLAIIRKK